MQRIFFLPILLAFACSSPTTEPITETPVEPDAAASLAPYMQLVGEWVDSTSSSEYTSYERWTAEGDSAISGFGHVVAGGDTVFIEDLRVGSDNGSIVYSARVGSQNNGAWVPFTAVPAGADTLMFENPAHDFPQCITYIRDAAGTWNVWVTGTEEGVDREERFVFRPR